MSGENTIDVAMVTWPNHPARLEYFERIVKSLRDGLTASRHELRFFCSAESQRDPDRTWCGHDVEHLCDEYDISLSWRAETANLGANMNAAMAMCTAPMILLQQDDWRLAYPLDLSPGADFLAEAHTVDLLRYSWPEDPAMLPTIEDRRGGWENGGWRQIDIDGKWPYGDDPHLRRRDFMHKFGWYYEGGGHGTASSTLMRFLVKQRATIAAVDKVHFKHCGPVSSVINDARKRRVLR